MKVVNSIEALLKDVASKQDDFNKSQRAQGKSFNIFTVTKIERSEVNTHSSIIAELLNPRGSHGQGDKFLTLFLNTLSFGRLFVEKQSESAKVSKEKSFNEGRVDILVEIEDFVVLIENKIDAADGIKQLKRYQEILDVYRNDHGKKGELIYLTLDGSEAQEYSHCGVEYKCKSYEKDVGDWLGKCIEAVNALPVLKHALMQYQSLIRKITGTTMNKEIIEILVRGNNIESAQAIAKALPQAKGEILFQFFKNIEQAINKSNVCAVSVIVPDFKIYQYNKHNCMNWFEKGRRKTHYIGVFFDIGIPNILFRVEVASKVLHYGIVPVKKNKNGNYELSGLQDFQIERPPLVFKERTWGLKWFSVQVNHVYDNVDRLRNSGEFSEVLINAIKQLQKAV